MLNLAIRNFGFLALAAILALGCNDIEQHTAAIRQSTAQIANAVTCHSADPLQTITASIDASMLRRFNGRAK